MDLKIYVTVMLIPVLIGDAYDSCFYPTRIDHSWFRKCPRGAFVSHVIGTYRPFAKDRMWLVCCRKVTIHRLPFKCGKWTDYENKFTANFNFQCPPNQVLAGLGSRHSDAHEDRRFRFRCCSSVGIRLKNCQQTEPLNSFGGEVNYNVSAGYALTGIQSTFSSTIMDRTFKAKICDIMKKSS